MEEDNKVDINLVKTTGNNLIDPTISKQEDIEDEISEQLEIMRTQNESLQDALTELISLAKSAQLPDAYKALAMVAKSVNESNRDIIGALRVKSEHIKSNDSNQQTSGNIQTTNNNIIMTTTEMIRLIKEKNGNGYSGPSSTVL